MDFFANHQRNDRYTIVMRNSTYPLLVQSTTTKCHGAFGEYVEINWRKTKHLFLSFVWPELPSVMAVGQWSAARWSLVMMRALPGGDQWIMVHASYAEMGGFMVQMPDSPPFTITSRHLHYLIDNKYTHIPTVTKKEILDKGKADESWKQLLSFKWVSSYYKL